MKRVLTLLTLALLAVSAQADSIDWVTVGDPENVADTKVMNDGTTGYGSVDRVYLIGKYEVTNAQYAEFLNAVATEGDPNGLYNEYMGGGTTYNTGGISRTGAGTEADPWLYSLRPNRDNRPVTYVSFYDALRFANWLHNGQPGLGSPVPQDGGSTEDGAYDMSLGSSVARKPGAQVFLTSENEWYKAAYYKGGGTDAGYWGRPTQSNTTPTSEAPPGTDLVNGSANYGRDGYPAPDPTYHTTEVGAYTAKPSDSAYGTYDQGGNVWEWNEADIFGDGSFRGLRGGGWGFAGPWGMYSSSRTDVGDPTREVNFAGFRVASIPEPGSITLLLCGLVGSLIWWRRRR